MNIKKNIIFFCTVLGLSFILSINIYGLNNPSRLYGEDRYKTSVEVSKAGFESSNFAILATGEDFPDALCATPLAKQFVAPILLTEKSSLNIDTEDELVRLGTKFVYVIGGSGVISDDVVNRLREKGIEYKRIYGEDRYATSVEVAKQLISTSDEAFIVTGEDFSDALSVSTIAAKNNMPILLIPGNSNQGSIKTFLVNKGIKKTYIIGGNEIISDEAISSFPSPERIYGADKYERNAAVIRRFESILDFSTVFIATGSNFPDALSGCALASLTSSPMILTGDVLSSSLRSVIAYKLPNIKRVVAVGGSEAVSDGVMQDITGAIDKGSGINNQKPYDEFASFLLDYFSNINFDAGCLKFDKITISQDSRQPNNINIFVDIYPDNFNNMQHLIESSKDTKTIIERWMTIIGQVTARQYPDKNITGKMWYLESLDSYPDVNKELQEIEYNPSTGKWDVLNFKLSFNNLNNERFTVIWQ